MRNTAGTWLTVLALLAAGSAGCVETVSVREGAVTGALDGGAADGQSGSGGNAGASGEPGGDGEAGTGGDSGDGGQAGEGDSIDDGGRAAEGGSTRDGEAGDAAADGGCGTEAGCPECTRDEQCDNGVCSDEGECVQCTDSVAHCGADNPICADDRCRGCLGHAECNLAGVYGGICDTETGRCLEEAEVIHVDDDNTSGFEDGSRSRPFNTLQEGVDEAKATGRNAMSLTPGSYSETTISDAGQLWIVGLNGAELISATPDVAAISLNGTTDLTVEGLRITYQYAYGKGVSCTGDEMTRPVLTMRGNELVDCGVYLEYCEATLDGNTIAGGNPGVNANDSTTTLRRNTVTNNGTGVSISGGTATLDGNMIAGNSYMGVSLWSCDFTLTNNIVADNGDAADGEGGISISLPGEPQIIQHNTITGNKAISGRPGGIYTFDQVEIRSSIIYGNSGDELSADVSPFFCLVEDSSGQAGSDNIRGEPPSFADAENGDYHIEDSPPSACIDAADPDSSVEHDMDGQDRPMGSGYDIGADEAG